MPILNSKPRPDRKRRTPTTDDLIRQAGKLAAEGKRGTEIARELGVSRTTAYSLIRKAKARGYLTAFAPWTALGAMQRGDPPEKTRWLLESGLVWEQRGADFAWYIHQVRSDLEDRVFIGHLADMCINAESTSGFQWTAPLLDLMLQLSPWEGLRRAQQFYARGIELVVAGPEAKRVERLKLLYWIESNTRRMWRLGLEKRGLKEPPEASAQPAEHEWQLVNDFMELRVRADAVEIREAVEKGLDENLGIVLNALDGKKLQPRDVTGTKMNLGDFDAALREYAARTAQPTESAPQSVKARKITQKAGKA